VDNFAKLWQEKPQMTLTGSYIQDREDYPGFWDHDIPTYLYYAQKQESIVKKTKEKLDSNKDK